MKKTVAIYALALSAAVLALEWLEYQKIVRTMQTGLYVVLLALGFTALGIWVGIYLPVPAMNGSIR